MTTADPLSEQDLSTAREQLAAGTPHTVWFTAAAVGVPAGGSAKIVAIDDAAEGDFIQVRPAGTRDTVFCSPNELTRTRPSRKRATKTATQAETPAGRGAGRSAAGATQTAASNGAAVASPGPARPTASTTGESPKRAPAAPRRSGPARAAAGRSAEATLTLHSTPDGEWSVEVTSGKKRTVRPSPVAPAAVAKAVRELPAAVGDAVEASLATARQRQAERVQRLRAELDAAAEALRELGG